jgi:hypothetical protein
LPVPVRRAMIESRGRQRDFEFRLADRLMERCGQGLAARNLVTAAKMPCSQNHSAS